MTSLTNNPPQPPYPTHAALEAAKQFVSHTPNGLKLLFWPLNADTSPALETSGLAVMAAGPKHPDPDVRTPYYDAAAGAWHPVSQRPISEPRVSEIVVRSWDVSDWARSWSELHRECADGGFEVAAAERGEGWVEGGCRGCGAVRPPVPEGDVSVVVRGTGGVGEGEGEGGGYVTVHDYVSTVHPWLVGLRGGILGAVGTTSGNNAPLPAQTELMVSCRLMDKLRVEEREDWFRNAGKKPSPGSSLGELSGPRVEAHLGSFAGLPSFMLQPKGPRRE
ncbi:uncharacterized protein B0H64DRAFT_470748 [Chaetomium fimeti]|uniref:Uncharacterized protein n=1 Tax=Chaetomium fimeti TaxID=1854472 RepID=A0AAE0HQP5_9PEZI|nr:hypothetical protein B0H64DRAFT_470748 [Chaetomium fimeti]